VDTLVLGFVKDLEKIYSNTGAFIIPLRIGSGIRIKIINAMTRGLPIVSTTVGCEGMDVMNGRHLLIADKAEEFADAVISLLKSKELRISLGKAAHAFCLKKYSRNQRSLFLEDVLSSLKNN
jgi:glycosyltransferase involved in cell wall biosynthesis